MVSKLPVVDGDPNLKTHGLHIFMLSEAIITRHIL